jgi:hypothetical protein
MNRVVLFAGTFVIAAFGTIAIGCGGAHLNQLKEAASADFNCPKHDVRILHGGKQREVDACGQHATYRWEDGDWRRLRTEPNRAAPAGPPAVAPAQAAPVGGTPTQPPPSTPAPGNKQL